MFFKSFKTWGKKRKKVADIQWCPIESLKNLINKNWRLHRKNSLERRILLCDFVAWKHLKIIFYEQQQHWSFVRLHSRKLSQWKTHADKTFCSHRDRRHQKCQRKIGKTVGRIFRMIFFCFGLSFASKWKHSHSAYFCLCLISNKIWYKIVPSWSFRINF